MTAQYWPLRIFFFPDGNFLTQTKIRLFTIVVRNDNKKSRHITQCNELDSVSCCRVIYRFVSSQFVTWFSQESHTEVDVVLAIADVLTSIFQKSYDALANDMEEETCKWHESFRHRISN